MAIGHFYFPTQEALQAGMGGPDVGEALADVPNYTNVQPQIQISEIIDCRIGSSLTFVHSHS